MLKPGDIFTQQTATGKFIFGRILLDVDSLIARKIIDPTHSALAFFRESYLVECFDQVSEANTLTTEKITVRGVFLSKGAAEKGDWTPIGENPVKPENLDFPEFFANVNGHFYLMKGELKLRAKMNLTLMEKFKVRGTILGGGAFKYIAAFHAGDTECIPEFWLEIASLKSSDLRFRSENEQKIAWKLTGIKFGVPYIDLAKSMKYDPARLIS